MNFIRKNWQKKLAIFMLASSSYFILSILYLHYTHFNGCQDTFSLQLIGCEIQGAFIFILFPYYFFTTSSGNYLIAIAIIPWLVYMTVFIIYLLTLYKFIFF